MTRLRTYDSADRATMQRALGASSRVLKTLGHRDSVRGRQRAIAFYLAHAAGGYVDAHELRQWCRALGAYNSANFAQNMTKEAKRGLVTGNIRRDGGWTLTEKGAKYAADLFHSINAMAAKLAASMKTITIKPTKIKCGMCRDEVCEGEHIFKCERCGLTAHGECHMELRRAYDRNRCANRGCSGRVEEHNKPAHEADGVADSQTHPEHFGMVG